jgi:hypothetical protein
MAPLWHLEKAYPGAIGRPGFLISPMFIIKGKMCHTAWIGLNPFSVMNVSIITSEFKKLGKMKFM